MNLPGVNLPSDTVGAFRLPLTVERMSEICRMFSGEDCRIYQAGDWIIVTKKEAKP